MNIEIKKIPDTIYDENGENPQEVVRVEYTVTDYPYTYMDNFTMGNMTDEEINIKISDTYASWRDYMEAHK